MILVQVIFLILAHFVSQFVLYNIRFKKARKENSVVSEDKRINVRLKFEARK